MASSDTARNDEGTNPRSVSEMEINFGKFTHIDKKEMSQDSLEEDNPEDLSQPRRQSVESSIGLNITTEVRSSRRSRHSSGSSYKISDNIHSSYRPRTRNNSTGTTIENETRTRHNSGRYIVDALDNRSKHNSRRHKDGYRESRYRRDSGRHREPINQSRGSRRYTKYKEDDLLHTTDFSEFKLPRNYLSNAPLPPKSPTFSFRSTIDLLPSSRERYGLRQLVISSISCSLGPLACGFVMAYTFTMNPQDLLGLKYGAWRTYVFIFGCVAGGFFSSVLVNLGRKITMLLTMVVLAMSWLFILFASRNWMLIMHQVTSGVCTGVIMAIAQVYVAEVSTPRHRGAISCSPILAFQVGMLLCYLLGEVMAWKNLAIIGLCTTTPFFFSTLLCMPESPRYLIYVRPNDALATLQWIRGIESEVMEEYKDIADNYVYDRWSIQCNELVLPTFWRPLIISCGLMFLYSMAGINSFGLYGAILFDEITTTYINASRFVVTFIIIIGMTISSLLMDQIGRKLVLLLSLTIMSATAFTLGLFLFLKDLHKVENYFVYQWVAEIFCVVLFTFAHGSGLGPIAWVTMGEIFGPKYKWLGVSATSMVLWSSMLASDVGYQKIKILVATGGVFWFHCVICVVGYIFVLIFFKELKEQSIDDISKCFIKKHDKLVDTFITRI